MVSHISLIYQLQPLLEVLNRDRLFTLVRRVLLCRSARSPHQSEYSEPFLMVQLIFGSSVDLALILLLMAIWLVLFRMLHHRADIRAAAYERFHPRWRDSGRVLLIFCGFLGVLYIVRMGMRI